MKKELGEWVLARWVTHTARENGTAKAAGSRRTPKKTEKGKSGAYLKIHDYAEQNSEVRD